MARVLHGFNQYWIAVEIAFFDHEIDLGDVHVHHASGADVQMPDFTVAHLPLWQADKAPAGVNESVGILGKQPVIVRFARQRNGIGFGGRRITPAIENNQNKRAVHRRQRILNEMKRRKTLPLINTNDTDPEENWGILRFLNQNVQSDSISACGWRRP